MLFNSAKIKRKRHHTLTISKENHQDVQRIFQSIQNFRIGPIVQTNSKRQTYVFSKQKEKSISQIYNLKMNRRQSENLKMIQKTNNKKLHILPRFMKNLDSNLSNIAQSRICNQLNNLIQSNLVKQIVKNHLVVQYNSSAVIMKIQNLTKILIKICLSFIENDFFDDNFSFLNSCLDQMKKIVADSNKLFKSQKNKLVKTVSMKQSLSNEQLYYQKIQLQNIINKKMQLMQECRQLQDKKACMQKQINLKIIYIQQKNAIIQQNLENIDLLSQQLKNVEENISKKQKILQQVLLQSDVIFHYAQNQSNNKLIKLASQQYKLIQSELYEYANHLQNNEFTNSLHSQSPMIKYFNSVIGSLDNSLKTINKNIIHNQHLGLEQKFKIMRDFILKMHDIYQKKDVQLQKSIDFKTKCITKFVNMMKNWLDNWTIKQNYLVSLRKEFAADIIVYEQHLNHIKINVKEGDIQKLRLNYQAIYELYEKLKENYLLANSFY